MRNMLSCDEQVQIQKYKTHAYKTPKTACVQTVMLKHPTQQKRLVFKRFTCPYNIQIDSMYTQVIPIMQTSHELCLIKKTF